MPVAEGRCSAAEPRPGPGSEKIAAMSESRAGTGESAHDVLAAEQFGMPGVDPDLHHGPVHPPDDPAGIAEPHDVLAAEEFPMPAARPSSGLSRAKDHASRGRVAIVVLVMLLLMRRRRRRRRSAL